ncbi:MAG: hypothetical protein ACP5OS_05510, partial [Leptospirillia bacterium]
VSLGQTPFSYDLPVVRVLKVGIDANGNPVRRLQYSSVSYTFLFSSQGFSPQYITGLVRPGEVNRLPAVTLQPQ